MDIIITDRQYASRLCAYDMVIGRQLRMGQLKFTANRTKEARQTRPVLFNRWYVYHWWYAGGGGGCLVVREDIELLFIS
jgi:hypothetical protein